MTSIQQQLGHGFIPLSIPAFVGLMLLRLAPTRFQRQNIPVESHTRLLISGWWRDDPHLPLEPVHGFQVTRSTDVARITALAGITSHEAITRLHNGHRLYVGWLHGEPVAYGWSATHSAAIGEIGCSFAVPAGERYLWDFATLPAWRGYGLYPRLLQAILAAECTEATQFWIAYLPENSASERGIAKAGFRSVGAVVGDGRRLRFQPLTDDMRSMRGAALLGLSHSLRKAGAGRRSLPENPFSYLARV